MFLGAGAFWLALLVDIDSVRCIKMVWFLCRLHTNLKKKTLFSFNFFIIKIILTQTGDAIFTVKTTWKRKTFPPRSVISIILYFSSYSISFCDISRFLMTAYIQFLYLRLPNESLGNWFFFPICLSKNGSEFLDTEVW